MIHVIPITDREEHIASSTCKCGVRYDSEWEMIIHEAFADLGQQWMVVQSGNFEFKRILRQIDPSMVKMFKD